MPDTTVRIKLRLFSGSVCKVGERVSNEIQSVPEDFGIEFGLSGMLVSVFIGLSIYSFLSKKQKRGGKD